MHLTKQALLLLFFCVFHLSAQAQIKSDSSKKKHRFENFDNIVLNKRQLSIVDSLYEIRDYYANDVLAIRALTKEIPTYLYYKKQGKYLRYHKNGNLSEEAYFKDDIYTGLQTEFFPDGKVYKKTLHENKSEKVLEVWSTDGKQLVKDGNGRSKEYSRDLEAIEEGIYKDGLRDSIWTGCYTSGHLCYTEIYKDGKLVKGMSHDPEGKDHTYNEVYELPQFRGGIPAMYDFISTNVKYPAKAQRRNIEGKVYIKFVVEKDGSVSEAYPLQPIDPSLDAEAMRVVKLSNGHWIGGKNRALPVRVFYILPLNFQLE